MGVLQRVTGWLSGRNSANAQTAYGGYRPRGYYGSPQAEDAYGSLAADRSFDMPEENFNTEPNPAADRFNAGGGDQYNGRVPYRSQNESAAQEDYRQMQPDLRHRRSDAQPFQQQVPYPQQAAFQQPSPYPQAANVVEFPQQQNAAPVHVEYVMLLRSRNECTKVIEYIKTNASVFLNMEYIANDSERQRCVDMLSGAAYTLGCQLHKISARGIYLIASPYVRVMIDPAMKRFNSAAESQSFMQQQTGEYPPAAERGSRPPLAPAPNFQSQMSETAGQTTAPYPPQQAAYSPFQRPRPTFQSQPQAEPFRRAAAGQYANRQPSPFQTSL